MLERLLPLRPRNRWYFGTPPALTSLVSLTVAKLLVATFATLQSKPGDQLPRRNPCSLVTHFDGHSG